jgi:hypothetical protein
LSVADFVSSAVGTSPDEPLALSHQPFAALQRDFARRSVSYRSDWADGWHSRGKVASAVLLLYVACLAPTVSFGGLAAVLTDGQIGVVEFLVRLPIIAVYAVLANPTLITLERE